MKKKKSPEISISVPSTLCSKLWVVSSRVVNEFAVGECADAAAAVECGHE